MNKTELLNAIKETETLKLRISNGNSKLGDVPNTSFPPVITCRKNVPCATDGCYALKFFNMYPSCFKAWMTNWELYKRDHMDYWTQLWDYLKEENPASFRFFVSGDIPDRSYFWHMILTARGNKDTEFLCFTKQYEIVNSYLDLGKTIPQNLHILFSGWNGLKPDNPHGLPETQVITEDMAEVPKDWKICGGNCMNCRCRGTGCWTVKNGETIAFHKH